ncbi:MAG: PilZ domain-containing protein [Desulfobacterales bacterium]|jgi:hypothetical protein|nr:PilZ domain-containing protein [Desulfobacterales bacterium]
MALPAQSVRKEQNKKRLLEMFERMTEEQQLIYLRHLEKLQANWKRSHARRRCQIDVDYDTRDGSFRNTIKDISIGGVFIETQEAFAIGQEIDLYLTSPINQVSCMVTGKVVRRDQNGIGIEFANLTRRQQGIIMSLMEQRG